MNLQVIEETWKRIEKEVRRLKSNGDIKSTSEFVRSIIDGWHRKCKTKKIPEFKSTNKLLVNIYTNTNQKKAIKEATWGLEHKQFIQAAWLWYVFSKED